MKKWEVFKKEKKMMDYLNFKNLSNRHQNYDSKNAK